MKHILESLTASKGNVEGKKLSIETSIEDCYRVINLYFLIEYKSSWNYEKI